MLISGAEYAPNYINPGNICFNPATMISMPNDIIIKPMIRVTTLIPVLPITRNNNGAARKTNQEKSEKTTTTKLKPNS